MDLSKPLIDDMSLSVQKHIADFCRKGSKNCSVLLVGDYMLDHYVNGSVERISPEAPVPVVKFQNEKFMPGGAGNVIANLVGLGTRVYALGRLGEDTYGEKLRAIFRSLGVDTSFFYSKGNTTLKTRIIGDKRQQILRLDNDSIMSPSQKEIQSIIKNFRMILRKDKIGCLLISDYAKGFCSDELCRRLIQISREEGIPVFIDPKKNNWECYSGSFLITPNIRELSAAVGTNLANEDYEIEKNARSVISKYKIENVLVTRSEKGSSLVSAGMVKHERSSAVEVYDVSGAGDTMISAVAAFYTGGAGIPDCVRIANIASQIVVGKLGTYAIKKADLMEYTGRAPNCRPKEKDKKNQHKTADIKLADEICRKLREKGKSIVFTNGCFDIIHAGHIKLLTKAKGFGDFLIVGLNSDSSVKRIKGDKRPVNSEDSRAKVLEALEAVDLIVIFDQDTPMELIKMIGPDVLVKGGDYRKEEIVGLEFAKSVRIVPLEKGFSTTGIINKIGWSDE